MNRLRWLLAAVFAVSLLLPFAALRGSTASAHPLGNFTINQFARLNLYRDAVRVHYVLDMAEIPTFQEMETYDTNSDGALDEAETAPYLDAIMPALMAGLDLDVAGSPARLQELARSAVLLDGQAGLKTLRVVLDLQASGLAPGTGAFTFANENFPDRLGWREVVVVPGDVAFDGADVPSASITNELRTYPDDMLSSPLDVRSASFRFDPGTGSPAPELSSDVDQVAAEIPSGFGGQAFADLISVDELNLPVIVLSLLVAFALGAVHALSPGHGKTIVAAYFVGSGGTPRQAIFLALTVTLAHTVGVLALGAVTLYLSEYILPEDPDPLLTLASGVVMIGFGVSLLWMRIRQRRASLALPAPAHEHSHGPGGHLHDHESMTALEHARAHLGGQTAAEGMPWRSLLTLGISGGILPSPTALIVLLGAVSLHRLGFGLALILSFSLGLATVLTSVGLAFVLAQRLMSRVPMSNRLVSAAPATAAVAIMIFGAVLATKALASV